MLKPAPFYLAPLPTVPFFQMQANETQLTIDPQHLEFIMALPYIGQIFTSPLHMRDTFTIIFDRRYIPREAWQELHRELTAETRQIDLDPIWEVENGDDALQDGG